MGSKQPSNTTQTTKVELPAWVDAASMDNYQFAQKVADRPLTQYQGNTVAGPGASQQWGDQYARDRVGSTEAMTGTAAGALTGAANYQPIMVADNGIRPGTVQDLNHGYDKVKAGQLAKTDLNPYLNPYIAEVENNALRSVNDSRVQSLMGNADKAAAAGAFGGSRSAIVDAVTNSEAAKVSGDLSAQLRSAGFDRATANATADIDRTFNADRSNQDMRFRNESANADRNLRAQEFNVGTNADAQKFNSSLNLDAQKSNQAAGLAGNGQRIQGALGLNQTANDFQQRYIRDYGMLSEIGGREQTQAQREIDADMAKFYEQRDYPVEQMNLRLSALGMSPYGKSETATKTTPKQGTDWAQAGVGALSLLGGLFSDRDEKTDIRKLGKDPATGIDMYAYRYKDDPKSYPKVVGPMAQDIEKKHPGSTRRIGGKMVVNA